MPFDRPTLPTLIGRIVSDLLGRLGITDALRRADAPVYGRVLAYSVHSLYAHQAWVADQALPDTAEDAVLDRWASIWLSIPRKAASKAVGTVTLTTAAGAVVGTTAVLRALDGTLYTVTTGGTATGATLDVTVTANDAGAAGNREAGQTLTLVSPVSGVQSVGVAGALTGGGDVESDAALFARIKARIQLPPQGGAEADYVEWALEVAGVTRAWVAAAPPDVYVRVMAGDSIPSGALVTAVQAYLTDPVRKPVCARITALAPIGVPLAITISGLVPDTTATRAAVVAEVADFVRREAEPGGTLWLSRLDEAIAGAAGVEHFTLVVPAANIVYAAGEIALPGSITWS